MRKILVLFPSTHDALRAEKYWPQSGFTGKLRPIPRVLSSSCGLCLVTELPPDSDPIQLLEGYHLEWEQIVEVQGKEYKAIATKLDPKDGTGECQ
ncbi:MAG: DUF3343 domain-containing protein [Bacillota bacterium]